MKLAKGGVELQGCFLQILKIAQMFKFPTIVNHFSAFTGYACQISRKSFAWQRRYYEREFLSPFPCFMCKTTNYMLQFFLDATLSTWQFSKTSLD